MHLIEETTIVSAYRLFSSPNNKQTRLSSIESQPNKVVVVGGLAVVVIDDFVVVFVVYVVLLLLMLLYM